MDHADLLARFDRQCRRDARPDLPGTRVERDGGVVRQVGADHEWNGVVWSDLDRTTADAAIAAQVRYFAGREFEWKLYSHDRPDDLGARLRAAGFAREPDEAVMVADIRDLAGAAEAPDGVRLHVITDPDELPLLTAAHERAFGEVDQRLGDRMRVRLAQRPGAVRLVVALAGDVPVSGARLELNEGTEFAGLWGGGTVPEWRGRGVYRALVAYRAGIAAGLGYRYLRVDASDQSRPILARLGFVEMATTVPYVYRRR